jgi:2-haloacid dehalogenase
MSRRAFLRLVGGAALLAPLAGSCRSSPRSAAPAAPAAPAPAPPGPIHAVAFDLFTIFDPRSVIAAVEAAVPGRGAAFALAWRTRQFDYAWLRAAGGRYVDFRTITDDALAVTAREQRLELAPAVRARLIDAYTELTPWPDSVAALRAMRQAGLRLAPLANYSPPMIAALLRHAGLDDVFEHQISTDAARTFSPTRAPTSSASTASGSPATRSRSPRSAAGTRQAPPGSVTRRSGSTGSASSSSSSARQRRSAATSPSWPPGSPPGRRPGQPPSARLRVRSDPLRPVARRGRRAREPLGRRGLLADQ